MTSKNSIGFVYNSILPDAIQLANTLMDSARRYYTCWISPVETLNTNSEHIESASIIVTIGGDGTILSTSRRMCGSEKPIFGIHIGGLGFLAQIMRNDIVDSIEMLSNNRYAIEKRNLIFA